MVAVRVLLTAWAWPTHYFPIVPLTWALRAAGHEVRVASEPALKDAITSSGSVAVITGPDLDHQVAGEQVRARQRPAGTGPGPGRTAAEYDRLRVVFGAFAAHSSAMLDDLMSFARNWRPDLVVFDPTTYAGPIVAAALGIPSVRAIPGFDTTSHAQDVVLDVVAPLAERYGVPEADPLGTLTLDPCPASIQHGPEVRRVRTRYIPYNGPAVLPRWLFDPPTRPRICLTWGTATTKLSADLPFMPPRVIAAIEGLGIDIVACLSPRDAQALGPVPGNVRIAPGLPLHLLLDSCTAIVHQGGDGTIMTSLGKGVPQLILPQRPDQRLHTKFLRETAAVITADAPTGAEAAEINEAVRALLSEPAHRRSAEALRAEMAAAPAPAEVVPLLEELAQPVLTR